MPKQKSLYDRNEWEEARRVNTHKDMYNVHDWYSVARDDLLGAGFYPVRDQLHAKYN